MIPSHFWHLANIGLLALSILFGISGNLMFIFVLMREKVLNKLAIVPLLVAYSLSSLGQAVFIELPCFHALVTGRHAGVDHPWLCQAHHAFGYLILPLTSWLLMFVSVVRWLHNKGTAWIRRPRSRSRVYKIALATIVLLSRLLGQRSGLICSCAVSYGVPMAPNDFLFCDVYSTNMTVPYWFYVLDSSVLLLGLNLPSLVTAAVYLHIYCMGLDNLNGIGTSGVTKGLCATFVYGTIVNVPVTIGRHYELSQNTANSLAIIQLTNNTVVLVSFLIFCQVPYRIFLIHGSLNGFSYYIIRLLNK